MVRFSCEDVWIRGKSGEDNEVDEQMQESVLIESLSLLLIDLGVLFVFLKVIINVLFCFFTVA